MKLPVHIEKLMLWHVLDELTPAHEKELEAWRRLSADNEAIFQHSADRDKFRQGLRRMIDSEEVIWQKIQQQYPMTRYGMEGKSRRKTKILWISLIGAAAVFILFFGIRIWISVMQIVPGKEQASFFSHEGYFVTTDGQKKNPLAHLDELSMGKMDNGEKKLVMKNDLLASDDDYDKLIAPTGSRFCLQLPGIGTFRLNSESWVSYPAKFITDSLHLIASGEVFVDLERATKKTVWFTVRNIQLRASRASFNIQYHPDETAKITLMSGLLTIIDYPGAGQGFQPIYLQPGQALVYQDSIARVINSDTIAAAAWKNGRIYYRNENILPIMRSLSRWYDFDYEIDSRIKGKSFNLDLPKDAPIKTVMDRLQQQGIHYSMGMRVITIKP